VGSAVIEVKPGYNDLVVIKMSQPGGGGNGGSFLIPIAFDFEIGNLS